MIKKNSIFILFLCGGLHLLPAQNLIPNGDVSRHDHPNCPFLPFEGMSRLKDTLTSETWINFTGCFQAIGGETHIGFGMTIDSFLPVSPCDAPFDPSDFNSWISYLYFNADNFQLLPIPLHIQDTLLLCKEKGEVKLSVEDYLGGVNLSDIQAYWDDGFVGTVRTFTTRGNHYLRLNHQCGHTDFEIFADEKRCKTEPFIPNVFSPNGDGINDLLYPFISSDFPIANYEFMIFDRWGNQLFKSTSNDPSAGWNGRFKGKDAAPGMYVWSLKFDVTMPAGVQQNQLSGEVLLIRY